MEYFFGHAFACLFILGTSQSYCRVICAGELRINIWRERAQARDVKFDMYILLTKGEVTFSFCVFMDLDFVSVHKNAKRELGQYPAVLTELAWSMIYTYCMA